MKRPPPYLGLLSIFVPRETLWKSFDRRTKRWLNCFADLFHGEHFGNLLAKRPLLRSAAAARKARGGLLDLPKENDAVTSADRVVAFNASP